MTSNYAVNGGWTVECLNGVNPSPAKFNPCNDTQKNGIYIHSTNRGGMIPYSVKDGRACGDPVRNPNIRGNRASNLYGAGIRRTEGGGLRNHQGFDYYAPVGTEVLSVKDGTVIESEKMHKDYGQSITIAHTDSDGNEIYTFYAHLSEIDVNVGDEVIEGQVIGKTGVSGNAKNLKGKNQHLHFELRTQKENAIGLTGNKDPNEIVDTKFYSRDPDVKPQTDIGIIKVSKDGKEEIMDTY